MPVVQPLPFQSSTVRIRSLPLTTERSSLRIVQRDTNAPLEPCARTIPRVAPSSWLMRTVNVPSPSSYAPSPSGMPTMRYPFPAESPTVITDFVTTPGCERTRYGGCELLGPVSAPAAAIATAVTVAATADGSTQRMRLLIFSPPSGVAWRQRSSAVASGPWATWS